MSEILGCVEKNIIFTLVFDTDIDIGLCYKHIFGKIKIINSVMKKIFIAEMDSFALFSVINGNNFVCDNINFVFVLIKEIRKVLERIICKLIVGIKKNKVFSFCMLNAEVSGS